MRPIEYVAPTTVEEAVAALAEKGEAARPLAGGTDILVQMRGGRRAVDRIVDVKKIPDLNELSYDPQNGLRVGAAVPCHRIYEDDAIAEAYPGLMDAATLIGGIQIQGRASLGGNLCNAAPCGDSIPALIAHHAVAEVAGPGGRRDVPVEDFCTAPGRTVPRPRRVPRCNSDAPPHQPTSAPATSASSRGTRWTSPSRARARPSSWTATPSPLPASPSPPSRRRPCWPRRPAPPSSARSRRPRSWPRPPRLPAPPPSPSPTCGALPEYRTHLVGVLTTRALRNAIQRAKEA